VVITEWFDTVQRRAEWIAQAQDVTVDRRTLIRRTDHDERGTFLGGSEVASLQVLVQEARRPGCATPTSNSASRPPNSARCCRPRPRSWPT
jgi:hypothetical protein